METPRVQYTTTADGVSIAYTVVGQGPPLVYLQPYTHQILDWTESEMSAWYEALAARYTVIRFDMRGFGFSDREAENSLEGLLLDLEAVIDATGVGEFDLVGISGLGFVAAAYAARNAERVHRLAIWGTPLDGRAYLEVPRQRSLVAVMQLDDALATEIMVRFIFGDAVPVTPGRIEHAREAVDLRGLSAYLGWLYEFDGRNLAEQVSRPTLVFSPRRSEIMLGQSVRQLAAAIPNCEFVSLEAGSYPYQVADPAACLQLLDNFLGGEAADRDPDAEALAGGLQTLLFTDLEASTSLTLRLGDDEAQQLLRGHNATVRRALEEHGGREVKHTGDGIMAAFTSAVAAVRASLAIQRELSDGEVRVRVGLNAGEPIAEEGDLFGTAVILAARVTDRAEPGQVLVTNVVRELCAGKAFQFTSVGPSTLKGFDAPIELFELTP